MDETLRDETPVVTQDEAPARRRRRRRPRIEEVQPEPVRIVLGNEDEQPEWMVSAGKVNGAASRRTGSPITSEKKEPAPVSDETATTVQTGQTGTAPTVQGSSKPEWAVQGETARPDVHESGIVITVDDSVINTAAEDSATEKEQPPKKSVYKGKTQKATKRKPQRRRNSRKRSGNSGLAIKISVACVLVAVLVIGIVFGVRKALELKDIRDTLDRGRDVFYENIYMNDIPLQGMTLDQAAGYVTSQVDNLLSSFKITLRTVDGRTWDIGKEDLQMKYDVADQLDRLWSIGHIGNAATCYEQIKALQENEVRQYSTMSYDLSKVNQILTQIKAEVDQPAINATRVDDETKWPPYSYTDDVPGQTLDITGLNERIMGMVDRLESGVVELTPVPVEAKVTRKALEGSIVKLATYETAIGATSHEGRFMNIQIGTEKFNHLIIHSGDQVSFNKVTGKRTEANGFVEAPEIAYGEYVMGIGGGICQVSSTLYNAVVNAGLEVIKRTQHSLASNYVPMGQDATVSDDRLDFIFRNSTNADIFIETNYYKKKNYWYTSFTIYGRPDPNGYTYKLESQVREEIPLPDPTYKPDRSAKYVVYDNQTQQISKGEKGYIVDVYLITTDSSGLQISRELKYTDTYKPVTPVYWIGVTPRITN